ncbi:MAG TPA: helix-turn-helix domain-containing protein, partial [Acidimicrobiia bacterium]
MAPTVERNVQDRNSPKDVGRNLRHVRKQQGLSRGAAARSAGLTRRELAHYERGKVEVPESDLWCLAGSCGVDVSELLPRREPLRVSPDLSTISTGDTIRHLRGPAEPDGLLREYLAMIYELRNLPLGSPVPLRQPDLTALADALGGTPDSIEHRLIEIIGASPEEAARIRAMILLPLSLPSAAETPRVDPYAALATPNTPPAVEDFFASPPATDLLPAPSPAATASPFAAPTGAPRP